jgi:endonuclease/exonuclease/phosphatase family metal-dependent hydrolase
MLSRNFALLTVGLVIVAGPDCALAQAPTVRVGSWNIANLHAVEGQAPEGRDFAARRDTPHYVRLQQLANDIGFDVVALQEIHSVDAAHRVFPASDWQVCFENGRKTADLSRPVNERTAIYTAVAVRKSRFDAIECFEAPELAILHREDDGVLRLVRGGTGTRVKKGDTVLTVLSVHLKSACSTQTINPPTQGHCETLGKQIPILNKWIDDASAKGPAVIVAGDFNRRLGDTEQFWPAVDDKIPSSLDLFRVPFGSDNDAAHDCVDRPIQIDHMIFPKEVFQGASKTPHYVAGSFRRLPIPGATKKERELLSDHCPIWGDFRWP